MNNTVLFNGKEYETLPTEIESAMLSIKTAVFVIYLKENIMFINPKTAAMHNLDTVYTNMPHSFADKHIIDSDKAVFCEYYDYVKSGEKADSMLVQSKFHKLASQVTATVVEYDPDGKTPVKAIATIHNIDKELILERDHKKEIENILESRQDDLGIIQALSIGYESVYHLDLVKNIVYPVRLSNVINSQYGEFFRSRPSYEQAFGAYVTRTTYKDDREEMLNITLERLRAELSDKNVFEYEYRVERKGEIRYFNMRVVKIAEDENGVLSEAVLGFADVNDQKRRWDQLLRNSSTDSLTGLGNRRAFDECVNVNFKKESNANISVISMDVNGLKGVNDTLGHTAGDELLCGAAECILRVFGDYGDCFRLGGDEFAIILRQPVAVVEPLMPVFERIVNEWQGMMVDTLRISYGCAHSEDMPDFTLSQLYRYADDLMYQAKNRFYEKLKSENGNVRFTIHS